MLLLNINTNKSKHYWTNIGYYKDKQCYTKNNTYEIKPNTYEQIKLFFKLKKLPKNFKTYF